MLIHFKSFLFLNKKRDGNLCFVVSGIATLSDLNLFIRLHCLLAFSSVHYDLAKSEQSIAFLYIVVFSFFLNYQ